MKVYSDLAKVDFHDIMTGNDMHLYGQVCLFLCSYNQYKRMNTKYIGSNNLAERLVIFPATFHSICFLIQNDALDFAANVGYPCLLRPSYVLR